ncbi:DUF6804 family protein [Curtobacterium sp. MCBA15_001]|uniref:DUF6804 family protein n=1 Tax=Curtobacterium sp. MCBA15_001 TaxID=1898731 RepID=UPI000A7D6A19|nr:DUF6804 family protein [Curtobacterium sp. MCBA15_001]
MAGRKGRPQVGSSLRSGAGSGRTGAAEPRRASRPAGGAEQPPAFTRPALAPGLLAAVVLLACVALLDDPAFVAVRWGVTVLALIVLVFALRGRTWWALIVTAAIAVCWNPLVTVPIPGQVWAALQIIAAAVFVVIGIAVKVPRSAEGDPSR